MTKPIPELTAKQKRNFWRKVDVREPDECWPWTGFVNKNGYGYFGVNRIPVTAQRVSMALDGRQPGYNQACHTCDNRICVNPVHLWAGSAVDNMGDRDKKGRNGKAKLALSDIPAIRLDGRKHSDIAQEYDVSEQTIGRIKSRQSWSRIA